MLSTFLMTCMSDVFVASSALPLISVRTSMGGVLRIGFDLP